MPWVERIQDHVSRFPEVRAICLFGSAARGQIDDDSDLDLLLLVTESAAPPLLRQLVEDLREISQTSVQVCVFTEERLRERFTTQSVFAAHIAREGRVILDCDGGLRRLMERHPKAAPVRETAAHLHSQWQLYADLTWCGGQYLFCLADLYALSRSGAMLALARNGDFEFDREMVFERLADVFPDLRGAAEVARRLRPFWEQVNRGRDRPLPFRAVGSDREAAAASGACRVILEKSL